MHVSVVNSYAAHSENEPVSTFSNVDFPTEGNPEGTQNSNVVASQNGWLWWLSSETRNGRGGVLITDEPHSSIAGFVHIEPIATPTPSFAPRGITDELWTVGIKVWS